MINPRSGYEFVGQAQSAVSVVAGIREGVISAESVLRKTFERIDAVEGHVKAWRHLDREDAIRQAKAIDAKRDAGEALGAMAGLPIAVKDIYDTADLPTEYGSTAYGGHRPSSDAAIVKSVRDADAVIVGKTVTTEFAYFTPGATANPWDVRNTPGGSSSGSAAAVAAGMVPLALGSQTAGSLIRPASYCGVFGFKPTHNIFPTAGAKALSPSLDTVGWLANSADDLELMRSALLGVPYLPLEEGPIPRIGVCQTFEWEFVDDGGKIAWERATSALREFASREISLPTTLSGLLDAHKCIMAYEAARTLAVDIAERGPKIGQTIHELVQTGNTVSDQEYVSAQRLAEQGRTLLTQGELGVDALLVPAAVGEAPVGLAATGDPIMSRVWTLLGGPCVNVPSLLGPTGLPIGMQLVGAPGSDRELLRIAAWLHRVLQKAGHQDLGST